MLKELWAFEAINGMKQEKKVIFYNSYWSNNLQ